MPYLSSTRIENMSDREAAIHKVFGAGEYCGKYYSDLKSYSESPLSNGLLYISFSVYTSDMSLNRLLQLAEIVGSQEIDFTANSESYGQGTSYAETERWYEVTCNNCRL